MNTQEKRIKLAEVVLDAPDAFGTWDEYQRAVDSHKGEVRRILLSLIPDPFTDANDCNALIKHLQSEGIEVNVEFGIAEDYVVIRRIPADPNLLMWKGKDWMHGVCELTLKVLE